MNIFSAGNSAPCQLPADTQQAVQSAFSAAARTEPAAELVNRRRGAHRVQERATQRAVAQAKGASVRGIQVRRRDEVPGALRELLQLDVGSEVDLRVIHRGVGAITKNDVTLASASTAVIIGFNVKPEPQTAIFADQEGVEVRFYTVIYNAIEDIEKSLKGLLKPEYEEVVLGNAEVRDIFKSSKFGNIAGSIVLDGLIRRNAKARTLRAGVVIGESLTVESLRRFKDDATEVKEGFECGIGLGSYKELEVGDVIQTYEIREKKRA